MARVLIAEDEALIVSFLSQILEKEGHEVIGYGDGESALAASRTETFDLAIVDIGLPGLDGLSLLGKLRASQPDVPRILMSGGLSLETVMSALNTGAVAQVLKKPFSPTEVKEAVTRALATRVRVAKGTARHSTALAECFADKLIRMALQPIVDAQSGAVVAYEALMRSLHNSLRSPLDIIAAAEQQGALADVADYVASRASTLLAQLPAHHKIFVNLHPHDLSDVDALLARFRSFEGHENRVVLEITERSSILDLAGWERAVRELRASGFALAIDDVGAGYNSLSVLSELQPKYIKIDRSIVTECHLSNQKRRLVELLSQFSESTDSTLIAEGVEAAEEADTLRTCGAHYLQGYYFGKPSLDWDSAPADQLLAT